MRIIPRNTKVATEFFTGVSLSDIVVGTVGVLLIFFVIISNLPYKIGICSGIGAIFVLLLVRIDMEANYMFLLRIVKHFSYYRKYRKLHGDSSEDIIEIIELDSLEAEENTKNKKAAKKKRKKKTLVEFFVKDDKKKDEGAAQA